MTIDDFNMQKFKAGNKAKYKDLIYDIVSVDFEEKLVGLSDINFFAQQEGDEDLPVNWVRCENIEFIEN
jgi:hypothetical protein